MVGMGIFMLLIALWLGVMGLMDQQKLWWQFQARRFRDPEANEPSESGYRSRRAVLLVLAVAMLAMAIWWFTSIDYFESGGLED
jgi:ferric-dicitrate binding protein FerR (iron transport regulator)